MQPVLLVLVRFFKYQAPHLTATSERSSGVVHSTIGPSTPYTMTGRQNAAE
jgi:hypothetical protein